MDIVTQGLLGAVVAQSAAEPGETRRAAVIGFCAGLLADADYFIQSSSDPLLNLDYHRHFTHSIFFIPAGALIAAVLMWPFFKRRFTFRRIYFYGFLGYMFSGLLDACTSYGTYLFWPLSNKRVAFDLISIVDPIFSGVLLIIFVAGLLRRRNLFPRAALVLCLAYLVLSFSQRNRALEIAREQARSRGHSIERITARPSFGNILLWRSVYVAAGVIYVDAPRPGFMRAGFYPGKSVPLFNPRRDAPGIPTDSVLFADIARFSGFSDGFVALHPDRPDVLGDVRYSMLPNEVKPLWGIVLNEKLADKHPRFETFRKLSVADRKRFLRMLAGEDAVR